MVYVPPPPLLVVRSHDPTRRWRAVAAMALAWVASVAVVAGGILLLRERLAAAADQGTAAQQTLSLIHI